MLKQLRTKITQKEFPCPKCNKTLRVPIKPGKTMIVSCPKCRTSFRMGFQNPMGQIFTWNKKQSIGQNISQVWQKFNQLPLSAKLSILFFTFGIVLLINMLIRWIFF